MDSRIQRMGKNRINYRNPNYCHLRRRVVQFFKNKRNILLLTVLILLQSGIVFAERSLSYCVIDAKTRKIVKEKDALHPRPPASTLKLLTAMVVLDNAKLDQLFTASSRAESSPPTKIDVKAGEQMSCRDLLVCLLVKSANDAAVVLAEGVAQSESKFAELMNKKAALLGCKKSDFVNASGLPADGQQSCAYDLALIASESLKYPVIKEMLTIKQATLQTSQGRKITIKSHNKMLWRKKNLIYGKTGWTIKSANTFAGFTEISENVLCLSVLGEIGRASCRESV